MLVVISTMRHQVVGWHWTYILHRHLLDEHQGDITLVPSLMEFRWRGCSRYRICCLWLLIAKLAFVWLEQSYRRYVTLTVINCQLCIITGDYA
jgi:hypothetical protein